MSNSRYLEGKQNRFTIGEPATEDPVLIVCPKCSGKAMVVPLRENKIRATCHHCGFTSEKSADKRTFCWHDENPGDGYFGFALWLTTSCCGNSLWAFNNKHLELLESYVAATLRERQVDEKRGWRNASFGSRLSKWIKSAKNREAILKSVNELKAKA
jgi:hypothetical protein